MTWSKYAAALECHMKVVQVRRRSFDRCKSKEWLKAGALYCRDFARVELVMRVQPKLCMYFEELQASLEANGPAYEHALLSLPCSALRPAARHLKMARSMLCCRSKKGVALVILPVRECAPRVACHGTQSLRRRVIL